MYRLLIRAAFLSRFKQDDDIILIILFALLRTIVH